MLCKLGTVAVIIVKRARERKNLNPLEAVEIYHSDNWQNQNLQYILSLYIHASLATVEWHNKNRVHNASKSINNDTMVEKFKRRGLTCIHSNYGDKQNTLTECLRVTNYPLAKCLCMEA